jgi:hypothetical protein
MRRPASRRSEYCPRIHDLEELQRLCGDPASWPELSSLDLTELTGYAVEFR